MQMRGWMKVPLVGLVLICAAMFTTRKVEGDEWLPVSPEDLKMTSLPEAPGAPAVFLYRQVDRIDDNKASTEYNYVRIKILTEAGRKYANVEIPFVKQRIEVSNIRARIIRPDGSIVNFDGKVYEGTVVKSKTRKILAKTFTVPDVQVGSIIDYHYNYDFEDRYIFDSDWILSGELFTRRGQFTLKPYSRDGWTAQWLSSLPKNTEPPKEGPDKIIRMTANNIPAFVIEEYMPPENELKFRVDFIYRQEMPEMDPAKFWKSYGKKANDRAESFVSKRKAMEEAVGQIVGQGDSPEVKLQKIYARVQQIRNTTYETHKSEQEEKREKLKPAGSVEDVWKAGFGSNQEINWVFLGLARAAGFEASPCWVSTRNAYIFAKERRNPTELNANVVLVKLNGKDTYLDPGTPFTPFGLLPWAKAAAPGLKLDKDGGSWILTTLPSSADSRIERTAALKLTNEGDLNGKLKLSFTGLAAQFRRMEERNEDDTERKKFLEEHVKDYIPAGSEVELTNKPDWKGSDVPLVAEFDLKVPGWASAAGKRTLLPTALFGATEKHLFEHAERTWPVYFDYPFKKIDDVTIQLPPGLQVGSLPKGIDQDIQAAQYTLKVESKDGAVHVQRVLRSDLVAVGQDKYAVLRGYYAFVRSNDDQQVVLQPGLPSTGN